MASILLIQINPFQKQGQKQMGYFLRKLSALDLLGELTNTLFTTLISS